MPNAIREYVKLNIDSPNTQQIIDFNGSQISLVGEGTALLKLLNNNESLAD